MARISPHKICSKCGSIDPATPQYFYRNAASKDGLRPDCKICADEITKEYRQSKRGIENHLKANNKYKKTKKGREAEKRYKKSIGGYLKQKFQAMKQRCTNPNCVNYKHYGGRGIKCKFKNGEDFKNYVIDKLQVDPFNLDIDRINNDGHYEPGNIRFVTHKENMNNTRRNL